MNLKHSFSNREFFTFLTILIFCGCGCKAQILLGGKCPEPRPVSQLDVDRYSGTWYVIKTYQTMASSLFSCSLGDYKSPKQNNGEWQVYSNFTQRIGPLLAIPAKLTFLNADGNGYINAEVNQLQFNNVGLINAVGLNIPYYVLTTDYDSYTVEWACIQQTPLLNLQFIWIMSRGLSLSVASLEEIKVQVRSKGISTSSLSNWDTSGCK